MFFFMNDNVDAWKADNLFSISELWSKLGTLDLDPQLVNWIWAELPLECINYLFITWWSGYNWANICINIKFKNTHLRWSWQLFCKQRKIKLKGIPFEWITFQIKILNNCWSTIVCVYSIFNVHSILDIPFKIKIKQIFSQFWQYQQKQWQKQKVL